MTTALLVLKYLSMLVAGAGLFALWLWAIFHIFPRPIELPPELSTEEVMRRIAALLEKGETVSIAAIDPAHADWARRLHPWPVRWLLRCWIERELRRPLGSGKDTR